MSGFCVSSPSATARSASASTDWRFTSGGHLGRTSASRTGAGIWVYEPSAVRTSSGCASAYASDSFIASVNRLTRSGLLDSSCCDVKYMATVRSGAASV
jgi:hypothetical protein